MRPFYIRSIECDILREQFQYLINGIYITLEGHYSIEDIQKLLFLMNNFQDFSFRRIPFLINSVYRRPIFLSLENIFVRCSF